jgi:uncharacterized protein YjdB
MSTAGRGTVFARPDYMLSSDSLNIPVGDTSRITAVKLSSATVKWTWNSSDTTIAKIDTTGLVSGIALGLATITATTNGGKSVKIAVTVTNPVTSLSVGPAIDSIDISQQVQLTATVTPSDATVSWNSVNGAVATVSSTGLVTGVKTGLSIITVIAGNKKVSIPIVVGIPPTGINVNPTSDTIKILEKTQFSATLIPGNNTNNKVVWSSSKTTVATVDTTGLVTGKSKGSAVITASSFDGSVKATSNITVTKDTLTDVNYIQQANDILIYPNPLNRKQLSIDLGELKGTVVIRISDINGKTVMQNTEADKQRFQLDINLGPGTYFVQFTNVNKTFLKKLVVE